MIISFNQVESKCLVPEGLRNLDSTCSVWMNAGFFVSGSDHKFIEAQFDRCTVAACNVDLLNTKKRTNSVNYHIKKLLDLWEPGSNLALQPHLCCVCACHAQWAFSHPLQAAVALA